jgi:hypothetical protein
MGKSREKWTGSLQKAGGSERKGVKMSKKQTEVKVKRGKGGQKVDRR